MRYVILVLLAMFLLAFAPAFASVDPLLLDKTYLHDNGYLTSDGMVPVIIQMNVPGDVKITDEFLTARNTIDSLLKLSGLRYEMKRDLQIAGAVSANIDYDLLNTLSSSVVVKYVDLDNKVEAMMQKTIPLINASDAWEYTNSNGHNLNGTGVTVAILDNGIYCNHNDLKGKTIIFKDFVNNRTDCHGGNHGTIVAGIIGANGSLRGVAPGVKFNIYRVLDSFGSGSQSDVIVGIQEAVADGSEIISMSLGFICSGNCSNNTLLQTVESIDSSLFVVAAGNAGISGSGSISIPGVASNALTVGATYRESMSSYTWPVNGMRCTDENVNENNVTCFSSRGPRWDGLSKPDIVAPGVRINSTCASATCYTGNNDDISSGTSFATPHVTGIAAIVKQKHPDWTPRQIKDKIKASAIDLGYGVNVQGAGRANALYAIDDLAPVVAPVKINNGDPYTNVVNVDIEYSCTDPPDNHNPYTGIKRVDMSNDNQTWENRTVSSDSGTLQWNLTSGDGNKTVYIRCVDRGGNPSEISTDVIYLDTTPPVTTISYEPSSPNGENGWYTNNVTVTLSCSDGGSGCNRKEYCVYITGSCNFTEYSTPFIAHVDGVNNVEYRSVDNAGNPEETRMTEIKIDKTVPIAQDNYTNDNAWINVTANVRINASDVTSGVKNISYCIVPLGDSCDQWQLLSHLSEGVYNFTDNYYNHTFYYTSSDNAGLASVIHSFRVLIDRVVPYTDISKNGTNRSEWYVTPVDVTLSCSDDWSGCNETYYKLNDNDYVRYDDTFRITGDGKHNVSYYSVDKAGNRDNPPMDIINIDKTAPDTSRSESPSAPNGENGWYNTPVNVTMRCSDATSGCKKIMYKLNDNGWAEHSVSSPQSTIEKTITVPDGNPSTLKYYSVDGAGNNGTENTATYKIDSVLPSVNITSPDQPGIYSGNTFIPTGNLISVIGTATVGQFEVRANVSFGGSGYKAVYLIVNDGLPVEMSVAQNGHLSYLATKEWNPPIGVSTNYNITVRAVSNAGNISEDTANVMVSAGSDAGSLQAITSI